MFEILKTPKYGLSFLMLTFFVYITAPIFEWLYLTNLLASGNLPQNADSIGLPFGLFVILDFFRAVCFMFCAVDFTKISVTGFFIWIQSKSSVVEFCLESNIWVFDF